VAAYPLENKYEANAARRLIGRVLFGTLKVQRTLATVAPAVAGFYIAGENAPLSLLMLALVVFFLHLSANALNDIADYPSDLINSPDRPLVSGSLSLQLNRLLAGGLMAIGLLFALILDWLLFAVAATLGLILWASYNYGAKLKDNPAGSTIYLGASTSTIPFLGGFIVLRNLNYVALALAFFLTVFTVAIIIDSLKDIRGDSQTGKQTVAVALGEAKAKRLVAALLLLPIFAYPLVWLLFGFSDVYRFYAVIPISLRLLTGSMLLSNSGLGAPRILTRFLIVVDFAVLALARPETGFSWL
jgi:4-hydroxybenzoate polyprenyltransferase